MITWEVGIHTWSNRWRNLKVFEGRLAESEVVIKNRRYPDRLGTAWTRDNRIAVYRGQRFTDDLDTIIHEFAHLVRSEGHDDDWQACYADAIREVTGIAVPRQADNYRTLCIAGKDAVCSWWKTSGNAFLWHMACRGTVP